MLLGGQGIGRIPYSFGKEIRDEFSRGRIFCGAGRINRKKGKFSLEEWITKFWKSVPPFRLKILKERPAIPPYAYSVNFLSAK